MTNRAINRGDALPLSSTRLRRSFAWQAALLLASALLFPLSAAAADTGTIHGRVLNSDTGGYLGDAHVTVEGTSIEAFTNSYGEYTLSDVPAGDVKVDVYYTGLNTETQSVTVQAGQTATADVKLTAASNETLKLDTFQVAAAKETNQRSIAINEQRFAPNIKTVVSTQQFGEVAEGNIGEFVKFLPGVTVDYTSADVRTISVRGVSPQYTDVSVDGVKLAAAASGTATRTFELEQVSINNANRTEIVKSRTPDIPADALGGSVNLISKSGFEYSHPELDYRAYFMMNKNYREFGRTEGPGDDGISGPTHKITPGADFTYAVPVNSKFAFTVSGLDSTMFNPQYRSNPQWTPDGTNADVNGITDGGTGPFLEKFTLQDGPKRTNRQSYATTFDWKITPENVLSYVFQANWYDGSFDNRNENFDTGTTGISAAAAPGTPGSFSPTYTVGSLGKATNTFGSSQRRKSGDTWSNNLRFVHTGALWTVEADLAYSHSAVWYHDARDGGYYEAVTYQQKGVTDVYQGIEQYNGVRPAVIQVYEGQGTTLGALTQINPFDYRTYTLNQVETNPVNAEDQFRTAKLDVTRHFDIRFPTTIKAGLMVQAETRDIQNFKADWNFIGPDGKAGTADDIASNVTAESGINLTGSYNDSSPFGFPSILYPSNAAAYQLYLAHPTWFTVVTTTAGAGKGAILDANIVNEIKGSQFFAERISAAYIMGDTKLLSNRLRLVYGIRFERTDDKGEGYLNNPNADFQNGVSGALATNDIDQLALLAFKPRANVVTTHYAGGYPSINASYNITDNLVARVAYAKAVGRPDLSNILPGASLPDSTTTGGTITVNNPNLKPEQADSYDASLEYYFGRGSVVTAGAFRKDFSNFFGSVTVPATDALLAQYGIDDAGGTFVNNSDSVKTVFNSGSARVTGIEFSYSQALTFLPSWARGFSVFANGTAEHLHGAPSADFTNFISRSANYGVAYDNRRFSAKLNWNYRGREKMGNLGYDPTGSAFEYFRSRTYLDVNFGYRISKAFQLFINGRNMTNVSQDDERFGVNTPTYARLYRRELFPTEYTFGVKGTF